MHVTYEKKQKEQIFNKEWKKIKKYHEKLKNKTAQVTRDAGRGRERQGEAVRS